jgi:hypothetical protein
VIRFKCAGQNFSTIHKKKTFYFGFFFDSQAFSASLHPLLKGSSELVCDGGSEFKTPSQLVFKLSWAARGQPASSDFSSRRGKSRVVTSGK